MENQPAWNGLSPRLFDLFDGGHAISTTEHVCRDIESGNRLPERAAHRLWKLDPRAILAEAGPHVLIEIRKDNLLKGLATVERMSPRELSFRSCPSV